MSIRIWLKVVVICMVLIKAESTTCQNIKNPFEIKGRLIDTLSLMEVDVAEDKSQESEQLIAVPKTATKFRDNPFEVNHIPLRKKDIKKQAKNVTTIEKDKKSKSFIFWTSLFSLIILTISVSANRKSLSIVMKSAFNENILRQSKSSGFGQKLEVVLLYLVFVINAGIFLLLLWHHLYKGNLSFSNMLLLIGLVVSIYVIRHLTLWLLGAIFPLEKEAKTYSLTIELFNCIIGLVLFIFNLLIAFSESETAKLLLFIAIGLVGILLFFRILRGLAISIKFILSNLLLFFIYLCTLEILPILVLVKILSKY